MSGDILDRIDATVAGRCPCGADPAPGSAWCSEDCRPTHRGPDTFGSDAMRWSAEAPPAGLCPCGCGLPMAELSTWELREPEVSDDGRTAVMRAAGGGGGDSEGRTMATRVGSYPVLQVAEVFGDRAAVDGILSILAGEPLEQWEARQVRINRLVEGCEALLGQRLPEWMRRVLRAQWASTSADTSENP